MPINVQFSELDWQRIERDWSAWWAHDLDRPMVVFETSDDIVPAITDHPDLKVLMLDVPIDQVLDDQQAILQPRRFHGDAWPRWFVNGGPGALGAFLGAQVDIQPETDTVWFGPRSEETLAEMELIFDENNIWWQRIKRLTQAAVERWGDQVSISHTSLGANMDILAALRTTQKLLVDLYDAPEEVDRLVEQITTVWEYSYDELYKIIRVNHRGTTPWAPIWSPKRTCMIGCDFCTMVSPKMFDRFIAPGLHRCFAALDHSFYHLDGPDELKHLNKFLAMENLSGIQWIPGAGAAPPEEWLPLLKQIRDGGKLIQIKVTADGALKIIREIGGEAMAISISDKLTHQEGRDLIRLLAAEQKAHLQLLR
jgi:5-methyltetrahydrofolate--homocysteine methyltransferase